MHSQKVLGQVIGIVVVSLALAGCTTAPTAPANVASGATATAIPLTASSTPILPPATSTARATPTPTLRPATPTPVELVGKLVKDDYQLIMRCFGQGSPTVVLDGAADGASGSWEREQVHLKVATFNRVCTYTRIGKPQSPLTSQQIAQDLYTLLTKTGVAAPYVLVGWSFASHNARLFASQYPDAVVGMVLVDPSHPDQYARLLAVLPPEAPGEPLALTNLRKELKGLTEQGEPQFIEWFGVDADTSAAQARETGSLGDRPLVVLTATEVARWPGDVPPDIRQQLDQVGWEMHAELAHLSSNSKHIPVKQSGHCIQCDQPELVIDAIRQVVEAARSR